MMTFNLGAGGFGPVDLDAAVCDAGIGRTPFACERPLFAEADAAIVIQLAVDALVWDAAAAWSFSCWNIPIPIVSGAWVLAIKHVWHDSLLCGEKRMNE